MKKKYIFITLGVVLFILLFVISFYVVKINSTKLYINGDNDVKHTVNTVYKDNGITLKRGKKIISPKKYKLTVDSNIKEDTVGKYKVKYKVKYSFKKLKSERVVNVVDEEAPTLTLNLDKVNRDYCSKKFKKEITYEVTDNYDKDLNDKVVTSEVDDKIIYSVSDSSGNTTNKEVEIIYDKKPKNKFSLNGKSTIYVILNSEYQENGASYVDGCGKKIDKDIVISGNVDTTKEGNYILTYDVEGEKTLTRNVIVYEKKYSPKTIYLTFDDGPGANTKRILDTLNKYGIKATFFVTNQFPSYQYLIGEEYNSGHTVAVHTYSHHYDIYSSLDFYIYDFDQMNEIIKKYTGSYSTLFRFPGGSSNTVSRKYATGIVSQIAQEMTNKGYTYFDWNISSGDASGANSDKVYNNVVNGVERCGSSCIVLLHDIKGSTASALDSILSDLIAKGYTFAPLSSGSPTAHHTIVN